MRNTPRRGTVWIYFCAVLYLFNFTSLFRGLGFPFQKSLPTMNLFLGLCLVAADLGFSKISPFIFQGIFLSSRL